METFEGILTDRGSKYAVSGGAVHSRSEALAFLKTLKRKKKFAKATHNTWACLIAGVPLKNDDGESGAGMVIVRMLERAGLENHIIVVTRWYGGVKLGGDRFRRVQDAVDYYLNANGLNAKRPNANGLNAKRPNANGLNAKRPNAKGEAGKG